MLGQDMEESAAKLPESAAELQETATKYQQGSDATTFFPENIYISYTIVGKCLPTLVFSGVG